MKQRLKTKLKRLNKNKPDATYIDENGNTFKEGDPCDCGDPECKIVIRKITDDTEK